MAKKPTAAERAEKARNDKVYEAEWAAGTAVLRPLLSVVEAQSYVNSVLKLRSWKNRTGIAKIEVVYVPQWDRDSCMEDHRTIGRMELTMGNMTEGVVLHELAHAARGDTDNSHPTEFLEMLIWVIGVRVNQYMANRLREELHLRKLL
jgi:hypothetical protein